MPWIPDVKPVKPVPPPVLITIAGITMAGWFLARPAADPSASGSAIPRGPHSPMRSHQAVTLRSGIAATGTTVVSPGATGTQPPGASPAARPAPAGTIRSAVREKPAISLPPPPAQLRTYVPVSKGLMAGGRLPDESGAAALTLDLGWESVLPAVMAAPAASSPAENTPASAAAGTILEEFVAAVSPPAAAPFAGQVAPDQVWQDSVRLADERFRAIFGREAFLRQSLQAARVLREAPTVP